jgi:hypothetical protein
MPDSMDLSAAGPLAGWEGRPKEEGNADMDSRAGQQEKYSALGIRWPSSVWRERITIDENGERATE